MKYTINKSRDTTRWVKLLPSWCVVQDLPTQWIVSFDAALPENFVEQSVLTKDIVRRFNGQETK